MFAFPSQSVKNVLVVKSVIRCLNRDSDESVGFTLQYFKMDVMPLVPEI